MQAPSLPDNEAQRLNALIELELLDSDPEERFDRITRVAQRLFDVEIALVSLVDKERQWFKSKQGLDACETGRDISFCGHAILQKETFVINNAVQDQRFVDNPLVTGGPNIRFYAGAQLHSPEGFALGTLCIIDSKPKDFSLAENQSLRDLADLVEQEIAQIRLRDRYDQLNLYSYISTITSEMQAQYIKSSSLEDACASALNQIINVTGSECGVLAINASTDGKVTLRDVLVSNRGQDLLSLPKVNVDKRSALYNAAVTGQPEIVNHPLPEDSVLDELLPNVEANSLAIQPLIRADETIGLLCLVNNPDGFKSWQLDWLSSLASAIAQLITADKQVRLHQRELQNFFDLSLNFLSIANTDGYFKTVNRAFYRGLGYEKEELLGRPFLDLVHPEDKDATIAETKKLADGQVSINFQNRYIKKDGGVVWLQWTCAPDTTTGQLYASAIDVTDQVTIKQQIEEQAQHTQAILDHMNEGVVTVDIDGYIQSVNPAIAAIFGYEAKALLGKDITMLMPDKFRPMHKKGMENYRATGVSTLMGKSVEVEGLRQNGEVFPLELALSNVIRHDSELIIGLIRDITERKRSEQAKSEFLSTVNHELRTPLTSICGALSLVNSGSLGDVPEKCLNMLKIAQKNGERLSFLINDLLDMEKLAAGKMKFDLKTEALATLVQSAVDSNQTFGSQRNVQIKITDMLDNVYVFVDGQRFIQIMSNLLSNAIKYSPDQGEVEVSVTKKHGGVRVSVCDHGNGIPEGFQDKIFDKFSQADSSDTRKVGGTGLGLAITRELVQRMGGTIGFESHEGQGTVFYFDFPLISEGSDIPQTENQKLGENGKILVIEDEPDVAQVLSAMLVRAGFQVEVAISGEQAEKAIEREKFDAITLDLMLPDKYGLEVLKTIKSNPKCAQIPVLVVSAKVEQGKLELKGRLNKVDWLAKPFRQDDLLHSLNMMMVQKNNERYVGLHVEDDSETFEIVKNQSRHLFELEHAGSCKEAQERLAQRRYDFILLDIKLPDGNGWDMLDELQESQPDTQVFVYTGYDVNELDAEKVTAILLKKKTSPTELLEAIVSRVY